MQVKGTGAAPTSWTSILEGTLDGANFETLFTHDTATGDGRIIYSGANNYPSLFVRSRVSALVLGLATNIVVTIVASP